MTVTPITLCSTPVDDTTVTVLLTGELDIDTADRIEPALAHLASAGERDIHINLAGVTFCDSSGVALFVRVPPALHDRRYAPSPAPHPAAYHRWRSAPWGWTTSSRAASPEKGSGRPCRRRSLGRSVTGRNK
ncbi:hypothetical protein GCM10009730_61460 [Streptomyces albidochromogenes]|uniref:STAS domain-containing protein n=1 Tax=Streptomyces albidochromogenes TaxID=329524 RepID=UPI00110FBE44|nr:STAS domain-containing protein [Streptomyces albidochromogenes]